MSRSGNTAVFILYIAVLTGMVGYAYKGDLTFGLLCCGAVGFTLTAFWDTHP